MDQLEPKVDRLQSGLVCPVDEGISKGLAEGIPAQVSMQRPRISTSLVVVAGRQKVDWLDAN